MFINKIVTECIFNITLLIQINNKGRLRELGYGTLIIYTYVQWTFLLTNIVWTSVINMAKIYVGTSIELHMHKFLSAQCSV